jgi:hypothetical protein
LNKELQEYLWRRFPVFFSNFSNNWVCHGTQFRNPRTNNHIHIILNQIKFIKLIEIITHTHLLKTLNFQ